MFTEARREQVRGKVKTNQEKGSNHSQEKKSQGSRKSAVKNLKGENVQEGKRRIIGGWRGVASNKGKKRLVNQGK